MKKKSKPKKAKTMKKNMKAKSAAPKKAAKTPAKKDAAEDSTRDIIQIILKDHMPLKELIEVMKDSEKDIEQRKAAFEEFCPLLTIHAKAEEQVLYTFMKEETEMREDAFEGDVEHGLADQMVAEAKETEDEDLLGARIKVLAELVEHHIEEEEEEQFPEFKKKSDLEARQSLGEEYLQKKMEITDEEIEPADQSEEVLSYAGH